MPPNSFSSSYSIEDDGVNISSEIHYHHHDHVQKNIIVLLPPAVVGKAHEKVAEISGLLAIK